MSPNDKLPVPGPWQPAARAAIADLCHRAGVVPAAVAVTRVEPAPDGSLELWLLTGGRTRRYRVLPDGATLALEPDRR